MPNILGYFCIFRSGDFSLFSTFNEYSLIRYNEYMLFSDIYFGFYYKLFFVLLGTSKFGHFIFETIRKSRKINSNIWNIKEYIAPLTFSFVLLITIFIISTILVFLFSRLMFFILLIISLIAQIWNEITWPSLYYLSLLLRIFFSPSANLNI